MTQKDYAKVTGVIFLLIALLHLLRIVLGWSAVIAGWMIPVWVSWVALVVSAYLSYTAFRLSK